MKLAQRPQEQKGGEKARRKCPRCHSNRIWKDGTRKTRTGSTQRFTCRDCGYRFSESSVLSTQRGYYGSRQVGAVLTEAKNLTKVESSKDGLAGATVDTKGRLIEYLWFLKKQGRSDHTINAHRKVLTRLSNHGANLTQPETVKAIIAEENVITNTKAHYVGIYTVFARWLNVNWNPPKYRVNRKLPYIPTENEINQLIAGFKRKTATFLQILKETMARAGEVWKLEWIDLNSDIISINTPEKGSYPRQFRLSENLTSMLKNLSRKDTRIFGPQTNLNNFRGNFIKRRKYLAQRLGNPRINKITFHTFRHWGATMLYHKTKDILYVQKKLGHRSIENTMIYTQLINFESDEWHVTHAGNLEEEDKVIQAGFEFVRFDEKENVAIYRKRK